MPGQDKTGPFGQGPLTGRGLGPCGRGFGFRRGRGFGRGFFPLRQPLELSETEEKKILESELEEMKLEMKEIEKRLKELKSK